MVHEMACFSGRAPPSAALSPFHDEQEPEEVYHGHADGAGGGQGKLCARGHWRPAEDAKLKELVAQHGPQNWNLIAENLDGRSGKLCNVVVDSNVHFPLRGQKKNCQSFLRVPERCVL